MSAATHNLIVERGATWAQQLIWKDSGGTPIDLTGYSARLQVRPRSGGNVLVSLTSGSGITLGTTNGTIDLTISAGATSLLPAGSYRYDLELVTGTTVTRLIEGLFTVSAEITA
jgi:hypothetical protein